MWSEKHHLIDTLKKKGPRVEIDEDEAMEEKKWQIKRMKKMLRNGHSET